MYRIHLKHLYTLNIINYHVCNKSHEILEFILKFKKKIVCGNFTQVLCSGIHIFFHDFFVCFVKGWEVKKEHKCIHLHVKRIEMHFAKMRKKNLCGTLRDVDTLADRKGVLFSACSKTRNLIIIIGTDKHFSIAFVIVMVCITV